MKALIEIDRQIIESGTYPFEVEIQGKLGLRGPKGDIGITPDMSIGTVETGEPGTPASASITGTPEKPVLNLTIPQGEQGEQGIQGETGLTPDFSIGTVTTGEAGTPASASITGTTEEPVLNLTIPQGIQGEQGIQGIQGIQGETGPQGETGATPAFSIGTVTTGAAGSSASASISGTAEAPVLNLTIPQGLKGDAGNGDMIADDFVETKPYSVGDYVIYNGSLYRFKSAHAAGAWVGTDAAVVQLAEDVSDLSGAISDTADEVEKLKEITGAYRYGVTGILNSSPTLTRLYDAVGLTAAVGTDTVSVANDFDNRTPFNRRKCVGTWNLINGKPVFQVNAYLGDADYTEDGTMGDYVAVECPRAFYKLDGTELVISAYQYPGYRPFDIFCRNHDPEDTMPYYYRPAYALAVNENGKAVCLPGYDNAQGDCKTLFDAARTYKDGALGTAAILMPAALNFYEWALFTVEFATNNCQSIMQGCSGLRHSNDDRLTFIDSTHVLIKNYFASRVIGECIAIMTTDKDVNNWNYRATHRIVSATKCDASGNPSSSGTYQLLELEDLGKNYFEYDLSGATEYKIASRPYRTGDCNSVLTPSGSPVSNIDSYHPMRYRYAENVFANQYHTTVDLFNMRVGTDDNDYYLEWYYIEDPTDVVTPKNWGSSDLAAAPFTKLGVETTHANYVSGYVKSKKYDKKFPDIWIPYETTGGSASTYFCDYAYLVSSLVVRSVRFGGSWSNGVSDGFSYAHAYNAPSNANAYCGGDLYSKSVVGNPNKTGCPYSQF